MIATLLALRSGENARRIRRDIDAAISTPGGKSYETTISMGEFRLNLLDKYPFPLFF